MMRQVLWTVCCSITFASCLFLLCKGFAHATEMLLQHANRAAGYLKALRAGLAAAAPTGKQSNPRNNCSMRPAAGCKDGAKAATAEAKTKAPKTMLGAGKTWKNRH